MRLFPLSRPLWIATLVWFGGGGAMAQTTSDLAAPVDRSPWTMSHLLDAVPSYLVQRLPVLDSEGAIRVSLRPHLGDFFHSDYVRLPVDVRWRVTPQIEITNQLDSYYAHDGVHAGDYGLSGTTLGAKWQPISPALGRDGLSYGLDLRTPFTSAPKGFSDGYRHVQPYVATTRVLVPDWRLLGYANLGANFFSHTSLPSNLGRNQLHANSLALALGVARQWSYFRTSLTARLASTALTSNEARQNFQLRPEVAFPLRRSPDARTQIMLTLGGRVMWGPDGRQVNTNGGVRVNFRLDRKNRPQPLEETAHFSL
jgi:hypothetical protein